MSFQVFIKTQFRMVGNRSNLFTLLETANKIAETFLQLMDSSEALSVFQTYQQQLNSTIANVSGMVAQIQGLLNKFDEVTAGLSVVVANQNKTTELQREFHGVDVDAK